MAIFLRDPRPEPAPVAAPEPEEPQEFKTLKIALERGMITPERARLVLEMLASGRVPIRWENNRG